jgi:hypothetical protein
MLHLESEDNRKTQTNTQTGGYKKLINCISLFL